MNQTEIISDGRGGQYLTAYWLDGSGQTLFRTLDEVREHVETH